MKKMLITMAVVVATLALIASQASATTFDAPKGSVVTASVSGDRATVTVNIPEVAYLEQYRITNADGKGWKPRYPVVNGSVTFDPYAGDRFQLVDRNGRYLFLSPELAVSNYGPLAFKGVVVECSNPGGCALQLK